MAKSRAFGLTLAFASALALPGCIAEWFKRSAGYDQRPVTLQTLSLFNQRTPSRLAKKSWKGDWILRRDRLDMIDDELRRSKPDIIVAQEVLAKRGSTSESDRLILTAGALADYSWREAVVDEFPDTNETQSQVIALGVTLSFQEQPAKLDEPPSSAKGEERESWVMGAGGFLMAATIAHEDQAITLFNVQMPSNSDANYLWYSFIQERISERLKRLKLCPKRVVVAGLMPADEGAKRFREFQQALELKDAALGFCQIDSRCYTATPTNDLFLATVGDESPSRLDRIFIHASALVSSSSRNFDDSDPSNRYAREFGLTRLWPTQRFGWLTTVRFARCTADEIEAGIGL